MYAFNKSHAAAYGYVSYITAYLKYHYPAEYMCAVLNNAKIEKIPELLTECKNMGIKVLCPDVNVSVENFNVRGGDIVYGLSCIKAFKKSSAELIINDRKANGKYKSVTDFLFRTNMGKTDMEKLIKCGAFDFFTNNREGLISVLPDYADAAKTIKDKKKILADKSSSDRKKENARAVIESIIAEFDEPDFTGETKEISDDLLSAEIEYLGGYISRHPMDSYKHVYTAGVKKIVEAEESKSMKFAGIIKGFRTVKSKKNGKEHAFFTLEDTTGSIEVCCFSEQYKQFGELLIENEVVVVTGKVASEQTDDEDTVYKIITSEISKCTKAVGNIMAAFKTEEDKKQFEKDMRPYIDENGCNLYYYEMYGDKQEYTLRLTNQRVNAKITRLSSDTVYVKRLRD